jgi:chorismate mutase
VQKLLTDSADAGYNATFLFLLRGAEMTAEPEQRTLCCRGVRGATTVEENTNEAILRGTRELLALMIRVNGIKTDDVASAYFTTTHDLDAVFPALAARQLNWTNVALMCGNELNVPGALPRCIRVMVNWNTAKRADEIVHIYIKGAEKLRPDKDSLPPVDWNELNEWINKQIEA